MYNDRFSQVEQNRGLPQKENCGRPLLNDEAGK